MNKTKRNPGGKDVTSRPFLVPQCQIRLVRKNAGLIGVLIVADEVFQPQIYVRRLMLMTEHCTNLPQTIASDF